MADASHDEPTPSGMAWINGGTFQMGSEHHYPEEAPVRKVAVDGFWMDCTPVTNAAFARFVAATGYVTVAERVLYATQYPGANRADLVQGSLTFVQPCEAIPTDDPYRWWQYTPGANWRRPYGDSSSIEGLSDHPVVHIAYEDATAFARKPRFAYSTASVRVSARMPALLAP